jgi:hypothetical protein
VISLSLLVRLAGGFNLYFLVSGRDQMRIKKTIEKFCP